ncbi:MAG: T9SS type B sorting domain-containing protein [Chitinophagales bacterium]|nr:T9SS type B sorting domain-containing protein [Chitinophagales bacterium]
MRSIVLLLFIFFPSMVSYAQQETSVWYFGEFAGLRFDEDTIIVLSDGQINTFEGTSCISDKNSNLLFYTDGSVVWNKNHLIMNNGSGLLGDPSSTQSSLILPQPGSDSLYFIFTTDKFGNANGLQYSIVDMSLAGGKGSVISKNIMLHSPVAEKITAAQHSNREDFWIIAHEWNSKNYLSFRLTENGIDTTLVLSSIGSTMGPSVGEACGYLKSNPSGNIIANAGCDLNNLQLFQFDKNNGSLSDLISVPFSQPIYGLEFSPSEKYIYLSTWAGNKIYRVSIEYWDKDSIINSKVSFNGQARALQKGPDGKIYTANSNTSFLGVIAQSDSNSTIGFNDTLIELNGRRSFWGLPNFAPYLFRTNSINVDGFCLGDSSTFTATGDADSVSWSSGDGFEYSSFMIKHQYSIPGNFLVSAIFHSAQNDTILYNVSIEDDPDFITWTDTSVCDDILITVNIDTSFSILWSDSSTDYSRSFNDPSLHYLQYSSLHCSFIDSFNISVSAKQNHKLSDTSFCFGDSVVLNAGLPTYQINWNSSHSDSFYIVSESQVVSFIASDGICIISDSIIVTELNKVVSLIEDRSMCSGTSSEINISDTSVQNISWYDMDTSRSKMIVEVGTYWLNFSIGDCSYIDSFIISEKERISISLEDTSLCFGEVMKYNRPDSLNWIWSSGQTGEEVTITQGGIYTVMGWTTCDTIQEVVVVDFQSCECGFYLPNAFSPNEDGENDVLKAYSNCTFSSFSFFVFDRWGSKIFESTDPDKGWDGNYKGKKASNGSYSFTLKYSFVGTPNEVRTGTLHLLR